MAPEIAPPEILAQRKPTIDDIRPLIIEEGCGLRPGRIGGIRLESTTSSGANGVSVPVVFNYG
jgi:D-amino-acid oxidase